MGTYICLDDKIHYHDKRHQSNSPIYLLVKKQYKKAKITFAQCQLTFASTCAIDTKVVFNIYATAISTIIIAFFNIICIITKSITYPQVFPTPS